VRLGDQALFLEGIHVVAERRLLNAELVQIIQSLATDRLVVGDEVLDDGAQHLELALFDAHCSTASSPDLLIASLGARRPPAGSGLGSQVGR
jgi:hypothetical protein